jgi:hypothetical protein
MIHCLQSITQLLQVFPRIIIALIFLLDFRCLQMSYLELDCYMFKIFMIVISMNSYLKQVNPISFPSMWHLFFDVSKLHFINFNFKAKFFIKVLTLLQFKLIQSQLLEWSLYYFPNVYNYFLNLNLKLFVYLKKSLKNLHPYHS